MTCAILSCGLSVAGCDRLSSKREETRVAVDEAPKHEKESRLTLTGAKVLLDRGGAYDRVCPPNQTPPRSAPGCMDHHFYVFPLVPEGWTLSAEVPAWITCSGNVTSLDACRARVAARTADGRPGDVSGTVAVRLGDRERFGRTNSGWEKAIDQAVEVHQLRPAPRGPVLRLGDE